MSNYALPGTNNSPRSHPAGPGLKPRSGRWYIPVVAAVGLGFYAYNYYVDTKSKIEFAEIEEQKRLAANRKLMDAYGSKDSLEDVQQAFEMYRR
ncbi:uncharacterized protein N7498_004675 [Penicillium cinerascens]|uniref:Uncharacterized protein n=1 Tax=Penicillium cinerascens TaxID=70096 RepID=A0A9W9SZN7_9EURO|nr:uncharacterized protein N7498_004675 [Penicillium cinerascens]KAJ5203796.1 hypothetical protein N7498_004675 [Penicillium cinerascens]